MLKKIILSAYLLFSVVNSFAQLPNSPNIHLLANINTRPQNGIYSACWGYVAPNGREYAIIGAHTGTQFVDITDTTNIHEVGWYPGPSTSWREMKVYSHYCYVVNDVTGNGMQIFDLQYLPDSVHLVQNWIFGSYTLGHTISQSGNFLYINGGNASTNGGIRCLDISNSENPVVRGQWTEKYVHDCRVVNDTIYACNIYSSDGGTISVINAANKDNLTTITSWVNSPDPGPHNCALTIDHKYCLTTDEIGGTPRLLKIWNIQNLNNVTQTATWQPTGITTAIVHNVEVYGNYAVIAHYAAGIRIVDISNPAAPTEAAWYDTYPANNDFNYVGCWGVFMFPSGKVIGSDMQTGLYVLKTTNIPLGIHNTNSTIPSDYSLSQNYPNPFNPSTTIDFSVPENSHIAIKLYDAAGRLIDLISEGNMNAGNYSVTYNASKLASGIYFYTMSSSDGYQTTRKIVLIK